MLNVRLAYNPMIYINLEMDIAADIVSIKGSAQHN